MRVLSIDPHPTTDVQTSNADYLTYLASISNSAYQDPPLPSGSPPKPEPIFIEDKEDDDIQIGTDNRMVGLTYY